jgi:peptidoglycan/LPS O-acetylase OafA/YrhL
MVVVHHTAYCFGTSEAQGNSTGAWLRWLGVQATHRMSLGVTLFFVISGYCIVASAHASRRPAGAAEPYRFLLRRFWRIYPPYWAAIVFFAVVILGLDAAGLGRLHRGTHALVLDAPSALSPSQWLGNFSLTETWRPHLGGPPRNVFTAVAWSLCFEEQFYLVCFLTLWLAPRRVFEALAAVSATLLALRVTVWAMGRLPTLTGTFPLLWHEFAVGLAVYYRLNVSTSGASRRWIDAGLVAMLAAGISTGGRDTAVAAAFGLALIALWRWDGLISGLAALKPLRACGRRCYSIYLAHLPVCVVGSISLIELGLTGFWVRALVVIPVVSAAAVAVGFAFFDLVESRFLNPPAIGSRSDIRRAVGLRPLTGPPLAGEAMGLHA